MFIQQTNRGKRVGKQNKNTKQKSCGEEIQKETTQESSRAIKHSTVCFEEHFQEKSWCKQKPVSYIIIVSTTRCVCLSFKDVLIMSIFLGLDISHVCWANKSRGPVVVPNMIQADSYRWKEIMRSRANICFAFLHFNIYDEVVWLDFFPYFFSAHVKTPFYIVKVVRWTRWCWSRYIRNTAEHNKRAFLVQKATKMIRTLASNKLLPPPLSFQP